MIPGMAKYFDHAETFLKMQLIGLSRASDPEFGGTSRVSDSPVSGMAPLLNLRTAWFRNWLISWVF
jgi:hypothetical protein